MWILLGWCNFLSQFSSLSGLYACLLELSLIHTYTLSFPFSFYPILSYFFQRFIFTFTLSAIHLFLLDFLCPHSFLLYLLLFFFICLAFAIHCVRQRSRSYKPCIICRSRHPKFLWWSPAPTASNMICLVTLCIAKFFLSFSMQYSTQACIEHTFFTSLVVQLVLLSSW